jgi:hypothetical protein
LRIEVSSKTQIEENMGTRTASVALLGAAVVEEGVGSRCAISTPESLRTVRSAVGILFFASGAANPSQEVGLASL